MSRTSNSVKNIISGLGLRLLLLILRFATRTLFIRYLGSEYLGVNSLISSLLSFLNITDLGIGTAIVFAMYKPIAEKDEEKIKQYLEFYRKVYHILGLIILLLGLALMPFLGDMIKEKELTVNIYFVYLLYLAGAVASFYVYVYRGGFISACQQEYKLALSNYIANILVVAVQIISLVFFNSFYGYIMAPTIIMMVQRVINGVMIARWYPFMLKKAEGTLSATEKKEIFKNVYGLAIAKITAILNPFVSNILISSQIGLISLGNYSNYTTLIILIAGFTGVFFSSLSASIGNLNAIAEKQHKEEIFRVVTWAAFIIYGVISVCIFATLEQFVTLWIGEQYVLAMPIAIGVILDFLLGGMDTAVMVFREACGLYYIGRYRPLFTAGVNIAFAILFCRFWGVAGIIAAALCSRLITIWWYDAYIVFKHVFGKNVLHYLFTYFLRVVLIFIICSALFYLESFISFENMFVNFISRGSVSLTFTLAILLLIYRKSQELSYLRKCLLHIVCYREKAK